MSRLQAVQMCVRSVCPVQVCSLQEDVALGRRKVGVYLTLHFQVLETGLVLGNACHTAA